MSGFEWFKDKCRLLLAPGRTYNDQYDDDDFDQDDYYETVEQPVRGREAPRSSDSSYYPERSFARSSRSHDYGRYETSRPAHQDDSIRFTTRSEGRSYRGDNVVDFSSSRSSFTDTVLVQCAPTCLDEVDNIAYHVRNGKICSVNLSGMEPVMAQQIMDFLSGAVFMIDGEIVSTANRIFLVAPRTGLINNQVNNEIDTGGHKFAAMSSRG